MSKECADRHGFKGISNTLCKQIMLLRSRNEGLCYMFQTQLNLYSIISIQISPLYH